VHFVVQQRLVGSGSQVNLSHFGDVDVVCLLLKTSVVEPVVVVELVDKDLLLEISSSLLENYVLHVFTSSILLLEIKKDILQAFLFVLR
jgi:hypothetical protein